MELDAESIALMAMVNKQMASGSSRADRAPGTSRAALFPTTMPPALQSTKLRNLPPRGLLSLSTVGATPSWDAIKRIEGIDGPRRRSLLLKPSPKPSDLTPLLQMAAQKRIGF